MTTYHANKNITVGGASLLFLVFMAMIAFPYPGHAVTITVNSTANSGPGTLRQAIIDANGDGVATIIDFDGIVFPGTVLLQTRLPRIVGGADTTIDGTGKGVTISGANLNLDTDQGLRIRASGTVVRGLTLRDFPGDAIRIQPEGSGKNVMGVLIQNNTITTKRDVPPGSGSDSISVRGGTNSNFVEVTISGNTVMRSTDDGILVRGSFGALADGGNTVNVTVDGNTINHSEGARNAGLSGDGIRFVSGCGDSGTPNNVIAVISNNVVNNSADQGILVKGAGCGNGVSNNNTINATIVGNIVRQSGQGALLDPPLPPSQGIAISGGDRAGVTGGSDNLVQFSIVNNTVSKSTGHGITVTGGGGDLSPSAGSHDVIGTITGNAAASNQRRGININGGRTDDNNVQVTVTSNTVRGSGEDGIRVTLGSGSNNVVTIPMISNNAATANNGDGILIVPGIDGTDSPVSGNKANRNTEDGIDITSIGYVLSGNRANKNGGAGIFAPGNTDDGGNTAKGNATCNTPGCY